MEIPEINALQHLKRVGDPDSKTNQKTRDAAEKVAAYLCEVAPRESDTLASVGYRVEYGELYYDSEGEIIGPLNANCDLDILLMFAHHVAGGLVERVEAEALEGGPAVYIFQERPENAKNHPGTDPA